jgi:hypothetical protein
VLYDAQSLMHYSRSTSVAANLCSAGARHSSAAANLISIDANYVARRETFSYFIIILSKFFRSSTYQKELSEMKKLKLFIVIALIVKLGCSYGQKLGHVREIGSGKPIKGARVKVVNKNIESMTDSLGSFFLAEYGQDNSTIDSLYVECNGYHSLKIRIPIDNIIVRLRSSTEIFVSVDEDAHFMGGTTKFYEYIKKSFQHPKKKVKYGSIFVSVVIDTTGLIIPKYTQITKGVNKAYDDEVLRLMNESPAWEPAKIKGRKVIERITLMIF